MTLPREFRIVMGFGMLAAAFWIWLQVFSVAPSIGVNARLFSLVTALPVSQVAPVAPGTGAPSNQDAQNQSAPSADAVVTREVQIGVLPFIQEEEAVRPAQPPSDEAPADDAEADAQPTGQGAIINPFTPVLAPQIEEEEAAPAAPQQVQPQQRPQVEVVEVPTAPPGEAVPAIPDVRAPIPNAVTPPSPRARALPRVLPSATIPGTPQVIRTALGSRSPSSEDVVRAAALSVPGSAPQARAVNFANQPRATTGQGAVSTLSRRDSIASARTSPDATPLNFAARRRAEEAARAPTTPTPAAAPETLDSYLRDNNLQFTGTVLGPTNVGVFRAGSGRTFVVPLGQTIPNTNIRLISLQGQRAVLVRGDEQATLDLNSGR
ncbi:MAG: hypothetical protein U5L04_11070 [Trueperaceae bacterium]|nr:hypothetical protein [Trueperaceae bacterium]